MDKIKLKALTKKWYTLLAETGFVDIERPDGNLKQSVADVLSPGRRSATRHLSPETRQTLATTRYTALETYYRMASQFLNHYHFNTEHDRLIYTLNCSGISRRAIAATLSVKGYKGSRMQVQRAIKRLDRIMFQWHKTQDNGT